MADVHTADRYFGRRKLCFSKISAFHLFPPILNTEIIQRFAKSGKYFLINRAVLDFFAAKVYDKVEEGQ
jgi:hypothetical protein